MTRLIDLHVNDNRVNNGIDKNISIKTNATELLKYYSFKIILKSIDKK